MAEFQLDTSGTVGPYVASGWTNVPRPLLWSDLSPFAQGYAEAILRESDPFGVGGGKGFSDLDAAALALILRDCERHPNNKGSDPDVLRRRGRHAWEDRNPTGALYGNRVTGAWFCPLIPYLDEHGKVHLRHRP